MQNQIQNMMLSKDTILSLHKLLNNNNKINNYIKENRSESLTILIKNMKLIYKMMDVTKINNSNFNSIFEQYKS